MDPEYEKSLRLFLSPFAIWTNLAFKTGQAMLATAHTAALRANAPNVAVIPTADAPKPKATPAVSPVRPAAKRFKATRAKVRSKANAKRRAKR